MPPNHYLSVAVDYLFRHRPRWKPDAAVGKTVVSSAMIDRVAARLGRRLYEVPVGFKWFVAGLLSGDLGFGGEESAGASFLRRDGSAWTTDKDGIIPCAARRGDHGTQRPRSRRGLPRRSRASWGSRSPIASRRARPRNRRRSSPSSTARQIRSTELAGEPIERVLTRAPGNDAPIGGVKVVLEERLVRRAAVRHRGHLQDLRRELSRRSGTCAALRRPRPSSTPPWPDAAMPGRRRPRNASIERRPPSGFCPGSWRWASSWNRSIRRF